MEKNTCLITLTLLMTKELRLEKGMQSAFMAEQIGKSPSAWAKIETGKSTFSMDSLFQVSRALWAPASSIVASAERYATLIGQHGWCVLNSTLGPEEDHLLSLAQDYYDSPGFKRRFMTETGYGYVGFNPFGLSVLNSPASNLDGSSSIVDLFRFVLDEGFRQTQLR